MSKRPTVVADIQMGTKTLEISSFAKWVPLICAGAAVGVSILALKEIKNIRKEIVLMKKENVSGSSDTDLTKQVERMDEQLRKITEYLVKQKESKKIVKNVMEPKTINIINNQPPDIEDDEEIEYIEVTDDES